MSAFMVDKIHIDLLVKTAIEGPKESNPRRPSSWHTVYYGNPTRRADYLAADMLGDMLIMENLASIHARYVDTICNSKAVPGPIEHYWETPYTHDRRGNRRLTVVEALKAIRCYEYQSCEHPGWKDSDAASFCDSMTRQLIACLPGYEDAPWELSEEPVPAGRAS